MRHTMSTTKRRLSTRTPDVSRELVNRPKATPPTEGLPAHAVGSAPAPEVRAGLRTAWVGFARRHPSGAQFLVFSGINVGMTLLQLVVMPVTKWAFGATSLTEVDFRWLPLGSGAAGERYYIFDYAGGSLPDGGGGLAYFLAVQITLALAQFINFFLQRNITFKSNTNPWRAAAWYLLAYVAITFGAAALQGVYKAPIYDLFITGWGLGPAGETLADVVTMLINALISVVVYFPIFRIIFRRDPEVWS